MEHPKTTPNHLILNGDSGIAICTEYSRWEEAMFPMGRVNVPDGKGQYSRWEGGEARIVVYRVVQARHLFPMGRG